MRKIIKVILLVVLLTLAIPLVSNAAIEVTEEKLVQNIEKLEKEINKTEKILQIQIDKEADKIILTDNKGIKYEVKYNLDGNIQFTAEVRINLNMAQEEIAREGIKIILPPLGFLVITDLGGQDLIDSCAYLIAKFMDGLKLDEIFDIENLLEQNGKLSEDDYKKVMSLYENSTEVTINDELFTFSILEEKVTEQEVVGKTIFTINTTADFSKIEGYAEKFIKELDLENKININGIINKTDNTLNQNKNVTANISKIPKTGNEISLVKILTGTIIMSIIMIILLSIYNRKRNS